jgi:hypothetical protein
MFEKDIDGYLNGNFLKEILAEKISDKGIPEIFEQIVKKQHLPRWIRFLLKHGKRLNLETKFLVDA